MPPVAVQDARLAAAVERIEAEFALSKATLEAILARFIDRMKHGLANDGQDMAMIPSFGGCLPQSISRSMWLWEDASLRDLMCSQIITSSSFQ